MRKEKNKKFSGAFLLIAMTVLSLLLLPTAGRADCTNPSTMDADNDGFTEAQECNGITLVDGSHFSGLSEITQNVTPRDQYLDPSTKDLFVILVPMSGGPEVQYDTISAGSLIPKNPTSTVANVGITTHEIIASPSSSWATGNRTVSSASTQKATRITEDPDSTLKDSKGKYLPFGDSNWSTPNGLDGATVWTQRVRNYITTVACPTSAVTQCTDSVSGASGIDAVTAAYIRNTVSHETGHVMKLTPTSVSKYGGYHYVTGSNVVMEQSIVYKNSQGKVTFTIPTAYASGDATSAKLQ